MTPASIIVLVSFCLHLTEAKLLLYPKFKPIPNAQSSLGETLGFTKLPASYWMPNFSTALYHIQNGRPVIISVEIVNLPEDDSDFDLTFNIQCHENAANQEMQIAQPFIFHNVTVCSESLPLTVITESSLWISTATYQLILRLEQSLPSEVPADEALTHYVLMSLQFTGRQWSLESSRLHLRNWDSIFSPSNSLIKGELNLLTSGNSANAIFTKTLIHQNLQFLTPEAIKIMILSDTETKLLNTKQFLQRRIVNQIQNASEVLRESICIGAFLVLNDTTCGDSSDVFKYIPFMSTHCPRDNASEGLSRAMQINSMTGKIVYSHKFRDYVLQMINRSIGYTDDVNITICASIRHYSVSDSPAYYSRSTPVAHFKGSFNDLARQEVAMHEFSRSGRQTRSTAVFKQNYCNITAVNGIVHKSVFTPSTDTTAWCPLECVGTKKVWIHKGSRKFLPTSLNKEDYPDGTSGFVPGVLFSSASTFDDDGVYKCIADDNAAETATINVTIVRLPTFSIPGTRFIGGGLPGRISAVGGFTYFVNCQVFHSGMKSVCMTPEFYSIVRENTTFSSSSQLSRQEFIEWSQTLGSEVDITSNGTTQNTSMTLLIRPAPEMPAELQISYKYVCKANVSTEDARKFGLSEYQVTSETHVVPVPKPTPSNFEGSVSKCCAKTCPVPECYAQYTMISSVREHLKSLGVEVRAVFRTRELLSSNSSVANVTFDVSTNTLKWQVDKGMGEMTQDMLAEFLNLIAVFSFHFKVDNDLTHGVIIADYNAASRQAGSVACNSDNSCFYTTDNDDLLVRNLKVERLLTSQDFNAVMRRGAAREMQASIMFTLTSLCCAYVSSMIDAY